MNFKKLRSLDGASFIYDAMIHVFKVVCTLTLSLFSILLDN